MPRNAIPQPIDENHTWNFKPEWWQYGYAKHLAEMQVQKAVAEGLDVVIVNPAVVMGGGDINRVGGDVLFQLSKRKFPFSLPGGLNVVHVRDVVRGHIAAMKEGRSGERYILAGENLTHLHFHRTIAKILKVNAPDRVLQAKPLRTLASFFSIFENILPVSSSFLRRMGYYFYYDNRKACRDLQLHQFLSAEQAVYEAYEWYRGMNLLN